MDFGLPSHREYYCPKSRPHLPKKRNFWRKKLPTWSRKKRLAFVIGLGVLYLVYRIGLKRWQKNHPPLYEKWHAQELSLPQHDLNLPFPEGRHGRYVWVSNQLNEFGWGNFLQELLLDAYLVHKSGRTFVFGNYTWDRNGPEYSTYKGSVVLPSRIPLTTMLSGPIVGGPFPLHDKSPRSVRAEFFEKVCPNPTKISGDEVLDRDAYRSTSILVDKWIKKFDEIDDRCIEISEGTSQIFSLWTFGSPNVLDIWPDLLNSPMLANFRWSPLIESGFMTNIKRIHPMSNSEYLSYGSVYPYTPLPGLLVLQARRGDYSEHCLNSMNWSADWQGFNKFPSLLDKFEPVPSDQLTERDKKEFWKRCYPSPKQIAERAKEVLESEAGRGLKNVYVVTNGQQGFIRSVKRELGKVHRWKTIMSSRDLVLDREQEYVRQAIDMLIGLRAQVVIGNGWSSMSSNIVMLRMALTDLPPDHHRFL